MVTKNSTFFLSYLIVSVVCTVPCWALQADVNYDGKVDLFDLTILADEWLKTSQQEYLLMMVGSSRARVFVPRTVARSDELECCYLDNTELWQVYFGNPNCTITLDTENYQCSRRADPSANFGSIKFTSDSNDIAILRFNSWPLEDP